MMTGQHDRTTERGQDSAAGTNRPTTSPGRANGSRRVSRRALLGLTLAGLLSAACGSKPVAHVAAPTPTPEPLPVPATAPTAAPTSVPAADPTAAPAAKLQPKPTLAAQGPIQMPIPVPGSPGASLAAQSQVIPPIPLRTRPYTNRFQVPERLQIPSIDLDSKVVPVGTKTDDKGRMLWETAAFAVGHHKGSGLPGESGNVVLSGHISSPREGAIFNKLTSVEKNDGVVVWTAERQFLYVVVQTKVVTPDAVEVLDPTDGSMVTMITCVPDGIYSHRLIVRAEPV